MADRRAEKDEEDNTLRRFLACRIPGPSVLRAGVTAGLLLLAILVFTTSSWTVREIFPLARACVRFKSGVLYAVSKMKGKLETEPSG